MSEVPELEVVGQLWAVNARLRELLATKDGENAGLWTLVAAQGLRIEALERQLASGSDDSGLTSDSCPPPAPAGPPRAGASWVVC